MIRRWKQRPLEGIERLHTAKLWYRHKPESEMGEQMTPLIRRSAGPSLLQDETLLVDGSWIATEALKAWEQGKSDYEYIRISEEQGNKIAQGWMHDEKTKNT